MGAERALSEQGYSLLQELALILELELPQHFLHIWSSPVTISKAASCDSSAFNLLLARILATRCIALVVEKV